MMVEKNLRMRDGKFFVSLAGAYCSDSWSGFVGVSARVSLNKINI